MLRDLQNLLKQYENLRPRVEGNRSNDWYRVRNSASKAEVWIYDDIGRFGVEAKHFVNELQGMSTNSIEIHLNSRGGEVYDGLAIYSALKQHPAHVTIRVDSLAASIATVIAMAGDRIVMSKNSELMIHNAHATHVEGDADVMVEAADFLNRCSDNIASIYAERAGGTNDEWRTRMKATTWYRAEDAVKAGLADEVYGTTVENKQTQRIINEVTDEKELPFDFDFDAFTASLREAVK